MSSLSTQHTQADAVAGSADQKPCSRCSKPLDRKGRYCKKCHRDNMRAWRKTRITVDRNAPFHVKPFVKDFALAAFEIREEDGCFVILQDGSPLVIEPPIEERAGAERIIDGLAKKLMPLPLLVEAAARHFQGGGEFLEG